MNRTSTCSRNAAVGARVLPAACVGCVQADHVCAGLGHRKRVPEGWSDDAVAVLPVPDHGDLQHRRARADVVQPLQPDADCTTGHRVMRHGIGSRIGSPW